MTRIGDGLNHVTDIDICTEWEWVGAWDSTCIVTVHVLQISALLLLL